MLAVLPWSLLFPFQLGLGQSPKGMCRKGGIRQLEQLALASEGPERGGLSSDHAGEEASRKSIGHWKIKPGDMLFSARVG